MTLSWKWENGPGWISFFVGGISKARLSPVFSCTPTMSTLNHKWNALSKPIKVTLRTSCTCKAKASILLHSNFNPVKNSLSRWGFIGKINVLRIVHSWVCYQRSLLLSDTHSGFWPLWWSRLQGCWTVIPSSDFKVILNLASSSCMFSISSILFYFFQTTDEKERNSFPN